MALAALQEESKAASWSLTPPRGSPRLLSGQKRRLPPFFRGDRPSKRIKLWNPFKDDTKSYFEFQSRRYRQMTKILDEALEDPLDERSNGKISRFLRYMDSRGLSESIFVKNAIEIYHTRQWLASDTLLKWHTMTAFLNPLKSDSKEIVERWAAKMQSAALGTESIEFRKAFELNYKSASKLGELVRKQKFLAMLLAPWLPESSLKMDILMKIQTADTKEMLAFYKKTFDRNLAVYRAFSEIPGHLAEQQSYLGKEEPLTQEQAQDFIRKTSFAVSLKDFMDGMKANRRVFLKSKELASNAQSIKLLFSPNTEESKAHIREILSILRNHGQPQESAEFQKMIQYNAVMTREADRLHQMAINGDLPYE